MRPTLLQQADITAYLEAGHWTEDTQAGRYGEYARNHPDAIACQDDTGSLTWAELHVATERLAANLIELGLARDARALVQMPTSNREMGLRIAFKKAGIIGAFVPMQWRRKELDYVVRRIAPDLAVMASEDAGVLDAVIDVVHRVNLLETGGEGWRSWRKLIDGQPSAAALDSLAERAFRFDEVSLITASSGTSGLAKLCEWPEAAQLCVGRGIAGRLKITADDNVGIYSPMSGAAGVLVWAVSGSVPCRFTFPGTYHADALLDLAEAERISVITTVPVILARLARADLDARDLGALRVLRTGTAAADVRAARSFEAGSGCRVVVASGSMECPGFGHAHMDEPRDLRLDGSVGLPLPGCRLRIEDDAGRTLPAGEIGELKVTAPFAASGYWRDAEATAVAWTDGWYATGDVGSLDEDGRLTLKGRLKEVINRSGHKILPLEVEHEISGHPDVFDCAIVGAPDAEYGQVPWAFVQMMAGAELDAASIRAALKAKGLASYKLPVRIIAVDELPRISGNKVDKKSLLDMAPAADTQRRDTP